MKQIEGQMSLFEFNEKPKEEDPKEELQEAAEQPRNGFTIGEWVQEHGKRVLFGDIQVNKCYITDYSIASHKWFKVVYVKWIKDGSVGYVDAPKGEKGEWSWGNSYSALTRETDINRQSDAESFGWWYELPAEEPKKPTKEELDAKYEIPRNYQKEEGWTDDWHYTELETPEEPNIYYCINILHPSGHYNYTYMAWAYDHWWMYAGYGEKWMIINDRREKETPFAWVTVPDLYYRTDESYQFLFEHFVTEKDWNYEKKMMEIREEHAERWKCCI